MKRKIFWTLQVEVERAIKQLEKNNRSPGADGLTDYTDYKKIALINRVGKTFIIVLLETLDTQSEKYLTDQQA
jgi:hypothetical protein